jgi:2-polyprenyl-3-methyl-5-hydroxy-6-metoxy-1,4-benzoquinol methylase
MNDRVHYTVCPVCGSSALHTVFKAKDHTVSGELFEIAECSNCTLRFTQDAPNEKAIVPYYKSEDYISHSNTSKGIINRIYKWVRERTIKRKRRLIEKVTGLKKGTVLDVGSGIGSFLHEMRSHEWDARGLEPDTDARAVALKEYDLVLEDTSAFENLPETSFDVITLWHVLEHVHQLQAYIQQLKKILKDHGKLFIAVPNYTSKDASIYREYWAAYDVPRHLYHFSPQSMETLMKKNGLQIEEYKPMWYDSFYISMLSNKYKTGKSRLLPSVFNGFRSNLKAFANTKKCSSVIYIIGK